MTKEQPQGKEEEAAEKKENLLDDQDKQQNERRRTRSRRQPRQKELTEKLGLSTPAGALSKKKVVTIRAANITKWGAAGLSFCAEAEADILLLGETHARLSEATKMCKALAQHNRVTYFGPAEPSANSEEGTHGGVAAAARHSLLTTPLAGAKQKQRHAWENEGAYVTGLQLETKQSPIIILVGYARNGDVRHILAQAAAFTDNGRRPFILQADFNELPEAFANSPRLDFLQAEVKAIGTPTCVARENSANEIDFLVVSRCLARAVSYKTTWLAPIATHAVLDIRVEMLAGNGKSEPMRAPSPSRQRARSR